MITLTGEVNGRLFYVKTKKYLEKETAEFLVFTE